MPGFSPQLPQATVIESRPTQKPVHTATCHCYYWERRHRWNKHKSICSTMCAACLPWSAACQQRLRRWTQFQAPIEYLGPLPSAAFGYVGHVSGDRNREATAPSPLSNDSCSRLLRAKGDPLSPPTSSPCAHPGDAAHSGRVPF